MARHVERSIEVAVPVRTAYDQWTQFEEFPRFMSGVQEVRQVGDALTHWVAEIAGVRREWDAAILEQVPDEKVAWAATSGATNAGAVYFTAVGPDRTQVRLTLEYEPEGVVERIGDIFDVIDRQAVADLDRFKEFIEQAGSATGGWRGTVENGDVGNGNGGDAVVPGDPVAVGPSGDVRGQVATGTGPTPGAAPGDGAEGVGHGGDPVAVRPAAGEMAAAGDDDATPPTGVPVQRPDDATPPLGLPAQPADLAPADPPDTERPSARVVTGMGGARRADGPRTDG